MMAVICVLAVLSGGLAAWVRHLVTVRRAHEQSIVSLRQTADDWRTCYESLCVTHAVLDGERARQQSRAEHAEDLAEHHAADAAYTRAALQAQRAAYQAETEAAEKAAVRRERDLTTFEEYVLEVLREVWVHDIGQNLHHFDPARDVVRTGKLHDFMHHATDRLQQKQNLTTVQDIARFLARGLA